MVSVLRQPAILTQELKSAAAEVHFDEADAHPQPQILSLPDEHPEPANTPRSFTNNGLLWSAGFHTLLFVVIGATAGMISRSETITQFDPIRSSLAETIDDALVAPEAAMFRPQDSAPAAKKTVLPSSVAEITMKEAELKFEPPDLTLAVGEDGDREEGVEARETKSLRYQKPNGGQSVTSGSFTAWTEPPDPFPNQPYVIVIQIRVPDERKVYPKSDLQVKVVGSDKFFLQIPDPRRGFRLLGNLPVVDGKAQLAIPIPGAPLLTRDEIHIESRKILGEKQTLRIEF